MVDFANYRRFHKLNTVENIAIEHVEEYLPSEVTELNSPPTGSFTLLLPPTTYGFGFQDKKWRWCLQIQLTMGYADNDFAGKLAIKYAIDVVWDGDLLDTLSITEESKDILSALLLDKKTSTDVVAGQGQGKVILLYGGPEANKPKAAKAFAELARRPLYQLMPYEIGIEPNQVEDNIKEAFYLGGLWGAGMFPSPSFSDAHLVLS